MKTKTKTKIRSTLILLLAVAAASACQSVGHGPISEPIVGIGAALLAAIDQLFAGGVISADQYKAMHGGVSGIQTAFQGISDAYTALKTQCASQQATLDAQWTTPQVAGGVGGAIAAAAAAAVKISNTLRDRNYTPEELAERRIKLIRARTIKKTA